MLIFVLNIKNILEAAVFEMLLVYKIKITFLCFLYFLCFIPLLIAAGSAESLGGGTNCPVSEDRFHSTYFFL